jgi:hypothetical protein
MKYYRSWSFGEPKAGLVRNLIRCMFIGSIRTIGNNISNLKLTQYTAVATLCARFFRRELLYRCRYYSLCIYPDIMLVFVVSYSLHGVLMRLPFRPTL